MGIRVEIIEPPSYGRFHQKHVLFNTKNDLGWVHSWACLNMGLHSMLTEYQHGFLHSCFDFGVYLIFAADASGYTLVGLAFGRVTALE